MSGIMVEFIVWTQDPSVPIDQIRKEIGLSDGDIEIIGDIKRYGDKKQFKRVVDVSSILYSTGYIETCEVEEATKVMEEMLEPRIETIKKLIDKYHLATKFYVVIKLDKQPGIGISAKFIRIMSALDGFLEFDTYIEREKFSWLRKMKKQKTKPEE